MDESIYIGKRCLEFHPIFGRPNALGDTAGAACGHDFQFDRWRRIFDRGTLPQTTLAILEQTQSMFPLFKAATHIRPASVP